MTRYSEREVIDSVGMAMADLKNRVEELQENRSTYVKFALGSPEYPLSFYPRTGSKVSVETGATMEVTLYDPTGGVMRQVTDECGSLKAFVFSNIFPQVCYSWEAGGVILSQRDESIFFTIPPLMSVVDPGGDNARVMVTYVKIHGNNREIAGTGEATVTVRVKSRTTYTTSCGSLTIGVTSNLDNG